MSRWLVLVGVLLGCGEQRVELFDACATCEGGTVDLSQRDPERCGVAADHCEDDEYCVAGACVCRPPLTRIDEACVDTSADDEHCGIDDLTCALCVDGACGSSCPAGSIDCDGGCVDTRTHPLHCGECMRRCGASAVCVEGECVPFRPAPCTSCPCGCARACCAYPGHPSDAICIDADSC